MRNQKWETEDLKLDKGKKSQDIKQEILVKLSALFFYLFRISNFSFHIFLFFIYFSPAMLSFTFTTCATMRSARTT
jgi:hypothetical protein